LRNVEGVTVASLAAETRKPRLRGWLHVVGAVVVCSSTPLLLRGISDTAARVGVVVYVLGLAAMLGTSATYHVPRWSPPLKRALRRADHSAIFLAVAGTYTPIVLATLERRWSVIVLAVIWGGAAVGILVRNVFHDVQPWVQAVPYVVLGWIGVLGLPVLWGFSQAVTVLVAAGGVAYSLGAVVYARRRPDPWPETFGFHEVFHALTLVAVALHWVAVRIAVVA
jgi:hemolysin III